MKHTIVILVFSLSLCSFAKAQNLVLNPSFELSSQCSFYNCSNWQNAALNSTCDYYSSTNCTGDLSPPLLKPNIDLTWYQKPLAGQSFVGFIPYYGVSGMPSYTEFLQGELNISLIANALYYIEFYINSASQERYFINNISALITDSQIVVNHNNLQSYHSQILPTSGVIYRDTIQWMRIAGYYMANGGEKYITIGNYTPYGQELKDTSSCQNKIDESYYFIDSVGVYEVTHLDVWDAGPDKNINYGDSVQIGNPNTDYSMFKWITSINGVTYLSDSTDAYPWSKPTQTTTYYVTKTQGTNVFKDTVTVYVTGVGIQQVSNIVGISIYPNPANNKVTIEAKNITDIKVFDVLGKEIASTKEKEFDVINFNNGVYFIQVQTKQNIITGKIIVQH